MDSLSRVVTSFFLAGALLVLVSCGPKVPGEEGSNQLDQTYLKLPSSQPGAVMLSSSTSLWDLKDGVMEYLDSARIMDVYEWVGNPAMYKRATDGQEKEFVAVKRPDGTQVWVQSIMVAQDSIPGIIMGEDAVVYKSPELASPTNVVIAKDTLLGVHVGQKVPGFIQVSAFFDGATLLGLQKVWVKDTLVDTSPEEVYALRLLVMAKTSLEPIVQKELLKNALLVQSTYSPQVAAYLESLDAPGGQGSGGTNPLGASTGAAGQTPQVSPGQSTPNPVTPPPASTEIRTVEAATGTFVVSETTVNVRNIPNQVGSQIVTKLTQGMVVTVKARTRDEFTISNQVGRWYQLVEPQGWVFGAYLKAQE